MGYPRCSGGRVWITAVRTLSESLAHLASGIGLRLLLGDGSSVVDCLDAKLFEAFYIVLHRLKDIGGVPLPVCEFARDQ
jgi:hypothetical protein